MKNPAKKKMGETFDSFNAPQFVDFSKAVEYFDESVDSYFDVDHENDCKGPKNSDFTQDYDNYFSPVATLSDSTNNPDDMDPLNETYHEKETFKLRKSMSVGSLILFNEEEYFPYLEHISEKVDKLNLSHKDEVNTKVLLKKKNNVPCRNSATNSLRRKDSQNHLNELAKPKRYASVENLRQKNNSEKFVSMAEAINKFQNRTPVRFRSRPNLAKSHSSQTLGRTIPESPALQTKTRSRPVHVLSQEERERIEFENQQKFKIKAHPVNKKILQGPIKPTVPVEKKSSTVIQPFKLTAVPPKKVMPSPKKYEFHAKPMPRSVEKPKRTRENEKPQFTKCITPTFMKNYKMPIHKSVDKDATDNQNKKEETKELKLTKPQPFSFESRDKQIQKKREQLINKIREEERKAREFHAKPVPKSIYRKDSSMKSDSGSSRGSSKQHPSTENLVLQFKAKPPLVLYKEPFIPAKAPKPLTELRPFDLSTEQRAQEREEYERAKREKEERLEYYKKLEEETLLRQEQEEIARLRKETQYKAQPIKKYKELIIKPSNKITEPISPNFQTDILRKMKNKENIPNNSNTSC